jgi:hypothetical protein
MNAVAHAVRILTAEGVRAVSTSGKLWLIDQLVSRIQHTWGELDMDSRDALLIIESISRSSHGITKAAPCTIQKVLLSSRVLDLALRYFAADPVDSRAAVVVRSILGMPTVELVNALKGEDAPPRLQGLCDL